ncbi:hypothetical protein ACFQXB_08710 [Plastorhodobacter daqingensis]|uniref:Carbohydrate kinase PfkB domain-containing protein n=1 Tax=Plastorhodobacter daqingensis TaxID=1387281 RepID=A0ABW2UK03_9RHOB
MHKRFAAIGECMVERAPAGTRNGSGDTFATGFAGDTFNTAWYPRRALPRYWQVHQPIAMGPDARLARTCAFMEQAGLGTAHGRGVPSGPWAFT